MELRKLVRHKYANCGVYTDAYLAHGYGWCMEYGFVSYSTKIIIRRGARIIYTGKYSRTTSKQLSWYLKEHEKDLNGLNADTLKIMARDNLAYNDCTGELEPLTHDELREIKEIRRKAFSYGYGW